MRSASKSHTHRKWIALALIILGLGILTRVVFTKYEAYRDANIRMEMQQNILEGATAQPEAVTIDYSQQIAVGSPLIFGGAHTPLLDHDDAWQKITDTGVTMLRRDFFIEQILPANITLEDYKANKNNITDPTKWNIKSISYEKDRFTLAHQHGMKTIGILSYVPGWLTYNGTPYSVPKDWGVYEDIIGKIYSLYRDDVDYLEIWNEPTYDRFLKTDGTNMTPEAAYVQIAQHAIKAIRKVDADANDGKKAKLGGLVADNPNRISMLEEMTTHPDIMDELSFISYHSYGHGEPSSVNYREILDRSGYSKMPLMLTEWNFNTEEFKSNEVFSGDKAITYTAEQLISYFKQGLMGASYFIMEPISYNIPGVGKREMGFYRWADNKAALLPQAKTWRLLSKSLDLGAGPSKVMDAQTSSDLIGAGMINAKGYYTASIINSSSSPRLIELQLSHLTIPKRAAIYIYIASKNYDGSKPIRQELAEVLGDQLKTRFYIPEESVGGVVIKAYDDKWFDFFDSVSHIQK